MNAAAAYGTRPMPLFDKYGGIRVLRHVIMEFYDRVLDSEIIGHFFENTDIARLIDHQTKFFSMVLGGPAQFSDERLAAAHSHLVLSHADFDEAVLLLTETLEEAGFSPEDRDSVLAAIEARRSLIVT
ncbi:MAG: group 1 truncated hemoglobin [Arenibacterium sp.]